MNKSNKLCLLPVGLIAIALCFAPTALGATLGWHQVWYDLNENGILDTGESGAAGITVELYTCDGTVHTLIDSTTTNAGGYYEFGTVDAGTYCEKVIAPSGYSFTLQNQGLNEEIDSDVDQTGFTNCVTLASDGLECSFKAGLVPVQYGQGLTPGFWKHNVGVYLTSIGYDSVQVQGAYSDPVNSPNVNKDTMGAWLDNGWTDLELYNLYLAMNTHGGGAAGAKIRNNAANVFNEAAGLSDL